MATTVITDPLASTTSESPPLPNSKSSSHQPELEFAGCDCCGLKEECTPAYIAMVRERFNGRWICGLCSEAVKDEVFRSNRLMGTEEAIAAHMSFCKKFSSSSPINSTEHLIEAMKQLLRRSLYEKKSLGSTPNSPRIKGELRRSSLPRSGSCISSITT
ncbi:hypothetical protein AMTRI_Chr04g179910 [Amborella trichopoda]|uniref:DUF1677 family protein n=1 Tax=Amborella trichopoda TaxID=13333 RepID=W1PTD9_AMBTC|nr:uncharacterized protein LOC18439500 [Amborella trichopoda]ERN11308.1 hypothetical protein AMTR_s00024p00245950 [Amborella trichopoda]|eukprot:XP_006849727.1 uncharacterized protein LOC18439500 [Amborella trichopoda]